jgi:hypothetical protein
MSYDKHFMIKFLLSFLSATMIESADIFLNVTAHLFRFLFILSSLICVSVSSEILDEIQKSSYSKNLHDSSVKIININNENCI